MAEEDQDQKTEQPTGKRLSEAREKGQLPVSREVGAWVLFLSILVVIAWLGPPMVRQMIFALRVFLEMPHAIDLQGESLQVVMAQVLQQIGFATLMVFALLAAAAVLGTMVQTGLFASTQLINPDLNRISPVAGFKRLFSLNSLVELGKSFGKFVLLGGVAYSILRPLADDLPALVGRDPLALAEVLHHEAVHLVLMLLLAFTVIAAADFFFQRFQYTKSLKMTKQEVKDEYKQQEGDPQIKARLRQIRVEKARKRMMAQVPKADVIITNPTHYAVALKYDNTKMAAPVVLAKGLDRIAERIREVAEEHKIPFVSNPPLARALYDTVDVDREIPTQHYRAVAEVISYVYKLKKRRI